MSLPAGVSTGTVTGTFLNPEGIPLVGFVTFVPAIDYLLDSADNAIIIASKTYVHLDAAGSFSVVLPATDDATLEPVDWTYEVTARLGSGNDMLPFSMGLPSGTTLDLADVSPVSTSHGTAETQGPPGPPGADGADGAPGADGVGELVEDPPGSGLFYGLGVEDPIAGLPVGGTTSQVLAKASNADYDTDWVTGGDGGGTGIVIDDVPPEDTDVLWADTTVDSDVSDTVNVFTYTDETDARPDATVVFWIPDPYDLPNPLNAEIGDLVLRSNPDVTATLADHEARIAALEA